MDVTRDKNEEKVHITDDENEEDFESAEKIPDMDSADKINQAKLLNEKAINYFEDGKYQLAMSCFTKIWDYIDSETGFNETENKERKELMLKNRVNLSVVHFKLKQPSEAKNERDKGLILNPNHARLLFIRGQALQAMGKWEGAKKDFEAVVKLEPDNKLAPKRIQFCIRQIQIQRQKEKKAVLTSSTETSGDETSSSTSSWYLEDIPEENPKKKFDMSGDTLDMSKFLIDASTPDDSSSSDDAEELRKQVEVKKKNLEKIRRKYTKELGELQMLEKRLEKKKHKRRILQYL